MLAALGSSTGACSACAPGPVHAIKESVLCRAFASVAARVTGATFHATCLVGAHVKILHHDLLVFRLSLCGCLDCCTAFVSIHRGAFRPCPPLERCSLKMVNRSVDSLLGSQISLAPQSAPKAMAFLAAVAVSTIGLLGLRTLSCRRRSCWLHTLISPS
jgi:hypothetical protein